MAEAANIAYTDNHIIDIRLTVIQNTRYFEKALGGWKTLPTTDKIWERFKIHFTAAQQHLKAIRGHNMKQLGYHQANHLAKQLHDNMQHRDNDIMSILHIEMDSNSVTPSLADSDFSTPSPSQHQANATQADTTQLEILKLLQRIQSDMSTSAQPQPPNNANSNNTARTQRILQKTPDNASLPCKKTDKYCWTHRGNGHTSITYRAKAPGHQDNATSKKSPGDIKCILHQKPVKERAS